MDGSRSMEGRRSGAALRASAATLARATAFLGAGHGGPFGARTFANGLRELDRFLSLLIDEVASSALPPAMDRVAFARQRNTANKLRGVRAALGLGSPDHERLRAIGRSRERLFHSAAPRHGVDSPQVPAWLRAAGLGQERRSGPPGRPPGTITAELGEICRFYDRLAAELLAACDPPGGEH
jgi:hypothetical protein